MVKVVSPRPVKTKETVCTKCGYKLEFTGEDVEVRTYSCMGETDSDQIITCPRETCKEVLRVKWP